MSQTKATSLEWLSNQNLAAFKGKWIVFSGKTILSEADTLKAALEKANLEPGVVPFVWKVPKKEVVLNL